MKIGRRRIPKLAATSLALAGCGDGSSTEGDFLIEEIDALAAEFCMRYVECYQERYGTDPEYSYENCRFYYTVFMYSDSLLSESSACDQAIMGFLGCRAEAASCDDFPPICSDESEALVELCQETSP